jgi:hypothetical protein
MGNILVESQSIPGHERPFKPPPNTSDRKLKHFSIGSEHKTKTILVEIKN